MNSLRQLIDGAIEDLDKRIEVLEENGSRVEFRNPKGISYRKLKIDGGIISGEECCDYLVVFAGKCYFVELKGKDILKALRQIVSSAQLLGAHLTCVEIIPVISATRVPKIATFQKSFKQVKAENPNLNLAPPMMRSSGVTVHVE